jgi:hypothetical protein
VRTQGLRGLWAVVHTSVANSVHKSAAAGAARRFLPQVAVGLALRIGWLVAVARQPRLPWADPWQYLQMAHLTAQGQWGVAPAWPTGSGQPTSFLSVGYPSLVGAVSQVTHLGPWHVAMGLNLVASVVLIVGVAVLAGRLSGRKAALAAAWIVALLPDLITSTSIVMTELVGASLVVGVALTLTGSRQVWWHASVLVAAAVWVRPSMQLLLVAVPLLVWRSLGMRDALRVAGVAMLLMVPLLWHSTVTVDGGVGFTTATWVNVCEGAAPDPGTPRGTFATSVRCDARGMTEGEWAEHARHVAIAAIRHDPVRWIATTPLRLWHSFEFGGWGIRVAQQWGQNLGSGAPSQVAVHVSQVGFVAVALAALVGIVRLRRDRTLRTLAVLAVASLVGVLVTFGQQRFGLPTTLLVFVPAAASLVEVRHSTQSSTPAT